MDKIFLPHLLPLIIIGFLTFAGQANASCGLDSAQIDKLSNVDKIKLNRYHNRVFDSESLVTIQHQKESVKPPPPPPPLKLQIVSSSSSVDTATCKALFDFMVDSYNSIVCSAKHMAKKENVSEYVGCISNFPGTPNALSNSVKAYSAATDDEPLSNLLATASEDLADFAAGAAICESTTSSQQFSQQLQNYLRAKQRLDDKLQKYQESDYRSDGL